MSDLIETKNRTLEETAALFDGQDATQHIVDAAHHDVVRVAMEEQRGEKKDHSIHEVDHDSTEK